MQLIEVLSNKKVFLLNSSTMKLFSLKVIGSVFVLQLFVGLHYASAQLSAGGGTSGASIIQTNINLNVPTIGDDTLVYLDIDCDSVNDLRILLFNGQIAIDEPNFIQLGILNNSIEICSDTATNWQVSYYNFGDPLCVGVGQQWRSDTSFFIACYGGFGCGGFQDQVSNKYIAYKKVSSQEIGWIRLSFDLVSTGGSGSPVTLTIEEMLVLCSVNSVSDFDYENGIMCFPNPSSDGLVNIDSKEPIAQADVFNSIGKRVLLFQQDIKSIQLPDEEGIYMLRILTRNGKYNNFKIVRL